MRGGVIRRNPRAAKRIVYLAFYRGFSLREIKYHIMFEMGITYPSSTIWDFLQSNRGYRAEPTEQESTPH